MSSVNKKGKLFGVINIIDLAVIVLLAVVIIGGIYRFKKAEPQVISQDQKAIIELQVEDIRQVTVDALEVGDEIYHYDKGQYFGEIKEKKVESYQEAVPTSDGKMVLADVPGKSNLTLYVESDVVDSKESISVGGEQTRIGAQFRIKNKKATVFGTVMGIEVQE